MAGDVNVSGPLFDGRARAAMDRYVDAALDHVAETGVNMVRERLDQVIRVNTGRYVSSIRTDNRDTSREINDGGVIYGPWLEGTGSRNYPKTRFPGYHTFRDTTQKLDEKAGELAQEVLPPYLKEMND